MVKKNQPPNLTPYVVNRLKEVGLNTDRIVALYLMGQLDLLKDIDGITDKVVSGIRALLTPDEPIRQEYCWVYRLAIKAFFGEIELSTLLYAEPGTKPLIDRVIVATQGTEEVVLDYLKRALKRNEREIIEDAFRWSWEFSDIAKSRKCSETYARQLYHEAMNKLADEETGIADDLMALVFKNPDSEARDGLIVLNGQKARLA